MTEFAGEVGHYTLEREFEGVNIITRVIFSDGEYMEFEASRTQIAELKALFTRGSENE